MVTLFNCYWSYFYTLYGCQFRKFQIPTFWIPFSQCWFSTTRTKNIKNEKGGKLDQLRPVHPVWRWIFNSRYIYREYTVSNIHTSSIQFVSSYLRIQCNVSFSLDQFSSVAIELHHTFTYTRYTWVNGIKVVLEKEYHDKDMEMKAERFEIKSF